MAGLAADACPGALGSVPLKRISRSTLAADLLAGPGVLDPASAGMDPGSSADDSRSCAWELSANTHATR